MTADKVNVTKLARTKKSVYLKENDTKKYNLEIMISINTLKHTRMKYLNTTSVHQQKKDCTVEQDNIKK